MIPPARLYDVASQVLDICSAGLTDAPERQYVTQSLPAFDCEELIVGADGILGHDGDISIETTGPVRCLSMRAAELSVWLVRCVPSIDANTQPPTAAQMDASAQRLLADPLEMFNALMAAYLAGEFSTCFGLAFMRWTSVVDQGEFGGGVLRVRVDLTAV